MLFPWQTCAAHVLHRNEVLVVLECSTGGTATAEHALLVFPDQLGVLRFAFSAYVSCTCSGTCINCTQTALRSSAI